jgi:hypothetical protein
MKRRSRILLGVALIAGSVAPVGALVYSGGSATAAPPKPLPPAYTCSGGDFQTGKFVPIPSGTYGSLWIKGACQTQPGTVITVVGSVTVQPQAVFDAQTFASTITIGGDITTGTGSLLGLGCLPDPPGHTTGHPCTDPLTGQPSETAGSSNITVDGNITASQPDLVLLNGITVGGNVSVSGSKGTANVNQRTTSIPWAIKNNTIGGNLTVSNATPIWIGLLLNHVAGNVTLTNIQITDGLPPNNDPNPTIQIGHNTIGQNLVCFGLGPAVAGGFGPPNVVGGLALGQCANLI